MDLRLELDFTVFTLYFMSLFLGKAAAYSLISLKIFAHKHQDPFMSNFKKIFYSLIFLEFYSVIDLFPHDNFL